MSPGGQIVTWGAILLKWISALKYIQNMLEIKHKGISFQKGPSRTTFLESYYS